MPNAAYCYDFPNFLQRYGAVLCVSVEQGQPWGALVTGLRVDWTFAGFHYKTEQHAGVRRLDLTAAGDTEIARSFWNRARRWAADNNKLMPLHLYPTPAHASAATLSFLFPDVKLLLGTGYPVEQPHVTFDYFGGSIEAMFYPEGSAGSKLPDSYWISEAEIIGPHCALSF